MITKLENGRIYDPINKINGKIKDLFIKNGKIIDRPKRNEKISKTIRFQNEFSSEKVIFFARQDMVV